MINSNSGIILNTSSTSTVTTTLPRSIMAYAVDEYLLATYSLNIFDSNYRTNETRVYFDQSNPRPVLGYSRRYDYGAIMFTIGLIYLDSMDAQKDYATFVISHYDSNDTLLNSQSVDVPYYQRIFSQYAFNSFYQPVKPSEYPESVYWSFFSYNFDTGMQAYGTPVWTKLIVLYTPTGYDYMT